MCGIAVALGELPNEERRSAAVASMHHRGPDGSGRFEEPGVFIGHTRLSIIDLSDAANQPMQSPDGRYVLAYNGELYNYVELRESLRGSGWIWRGHSDTEVLLALLALEGASCLPRLRGMFAFALWDRERRSLLSARDPLGVKPLYYSHNGNRTLVASELRTLCVLGGGERLDRRAVDSFLITGSVRGPQTILAGVRSLPPGRALEIVAGEARERAYWRIPTGATDLRPRDELVEELDDLLRESVRIQLRSDVPVGTFLSGGLDSSLVTSYAAEHLGGSVKTFSVAFETEGPARGETWDETGSAALVSDLYATDHERVVVTHAEFAARMTEVAQAIDQPSVDGVNSYFVCSAAAPAVKVALSGQGGDELFAGYNLFQLASLVGRINERLPRLPRPAPQLGRTVLRLPTRAQHNWHTLAAAAVLTRGQVLLDRVWNPLFSAAEIGAETLPPPERESNGDLVNAVSRLSISDYLRNTLLRDMDVMSMAHSLEVRVPIVDHVLTEFALSIPGHQKVAWGDSKSLLRSLARRRLPSRLLERKKFGFQLPLAEWLRRSPSDRALDETLASDLVAAAGLVSPALVRRELSWLRRPRPGDIPWLRAHRVWALYVLHEWHAQWTTLQKTSQAR
jgi:asparagine synthase (glutamine-hydrolysing)